MGVNIGSTIAQSFSVGSSPVSGIYIGSTSVWEDIVDGDPIVNSNFANQAFSNDGFSWTRDNTLDIKGLKYEQNDNCTCISII